MTLIVGIKSKEGIVLAADGAATLGSMGNRTVIQSVKKLSTIQDKIIVGVSGSVGLSQRINGVVDKLWTEKVVSSLQPFEAMTEISKLLRTHIFPEMQAAQQSLPVLGNQIAAQSAVTYSLIAIPVNKKLCLFQFDHQGSPEEATDDLPFCCVGSGQSIADPFICFLRKILWSDNLPSLNIAKFTAVWTLKHAIEINPGGVSDPIQLVTLKQDRQSIATEEASKEEIEEHLTNIKGAEKALAGFMENFANAENAQELPAA